MRRREVGVGAAFKEAGGAGFRGLVAARYMSPNMVTSEP